MFVPFHKIKQQGFTLLEVMIAISITALIGVASTNLLSNIIETKMLPINVQSSWLHYNGLTSLLVAMLSKSLIAASETNMAMTKPPSFWMIVITLPNGLDSVGETAQLTTTLEQKFNEWLFRFSILTMKNVKRLNCA